MNGYLQGPDGNYSSSRLGAIIVIMAALLFSASIILIGYLQNTSVMVIAPASGTIFVTIAGPAMVFLFAQKKTEEKAIIDKIEANSTETQTANQ